MREREREIFYKISVFAAIFHGLIFLVKVTCRLWKSTFENLENNALLFTCESAVTGIERRSDSSCLFG